MVKKYKHIRVSIEAYKGFRDKQKKMEKRVTKWTGKNTKIPLTRVVTAVACEADVQLDEKKVIKLVRKKFR